MTPIEAEIARQDAEELARRHEPKRRYDPVPVLPAMVELDALIPKVRP